MLAINFPGQGAQVLGMGHDFYDQYPAAKAVFDEADSILDWHLSTLCFAGDPAQLARTRYTQAALFTTEMAILAALKTELDLPITFAAGHSLGEYSALAAAGAISFETGLRLVNQRGILMDAASRNEQGMLAVANLATQEVEEVRQELNLAGHALDVACYNDTEQTVLAGDGTAITLAIEALEKRGAKAVRLKVSAAFHSRAMQECAASFSQQLQAIDWQALQFGVVANESARPYPQDTSLWPGILTRQLTQPVQWLQTMRFLCAQGVTHVLEIGPGKVLSRLAKSILPALQVANVATLEDVAHAQRFVAGVTPAATQLVFIGRCLAHAAATRNQRANIDGFEQHCRQPYQSVMQRYQQLRDQPEAIRREDCAQAVAMLQAVMAHKEVAPQEQATRWEELAWYDRHALVAAQLAARAVAA